MSVVERVARTVPGLEEWCESTGTANYLVGNLLMGVDEWLDDAVNGAIRLPFQMTIFTDRAFHRKVGVILMGFGVPRSRMGSTLTDHMGPDPDAKPILSIVSQSLGPTTRISS